MKNSQEVTDILEQIPELKKYVEDIRKIKEQPNPAALLNTIFSWEPLIMSIWKRGLDSNLGKRRSKYLLQEFGKLFYSYFKDEVNTESPKYLDLIVDKESLTISIAFKEIDDFWLLITGEKGHFEKEEFVPAKLSYQVCVSLDCEEDDDISAVFICGDGKEWGDDNQSWIYTDTDGADSIHNSFLALFLKRFLKAKGEKVTRNLLQDALDLANAL